MMPDMKHERAEDLDQLHLTVGEEVDLESLRAAVVPPNLMLLPFLETPDAIDVASQRGLDEDGVHGSIYRLKATKPYTGNLVVGFRDLRTQEVTHKKAIPTVVD